MKTLAKEKHGVKSAFGSCGLLFEHVHPLPQAPGMLDTVLHAKNDAAHASSVSMNEAWFEPSLTLSSQFPIELDCEAYAARLTHLSDVTDHVVGGSSFTCAAPASFRGRKRPPDTGFWLNLLKP